ncbi:hypothetical protein R50072_18770 [Simiduia litorea]|uniref:hypothetical protein n=1 Tax=Simiduia litorea TaxID=1435348 RepID=UPI0036F3ED9A
MKSTIIDDAIEASNQLIQALEAGELETVSSLVVIRDRLIREMPISGSTKKAMTDCDRSHEGLLQLQVLDSRIQQLANALLKKNQPQPQTKTHTDANKQKLNKGYKSSGS